VTSPSSIHPSQVTIPFASRRDCGGSHLQCMESSLGSTTHTIQSRVVHHSGEIVAIVVHVSRTHAPLETPPTQFTVHHNAVQYTLHYRHTHTASSQSHFPCFSDSRTNGYFSQVSACSVHKRCLSSIMSVEKSMTKSRPWPRPRPRIRRSHASCHDVAGYQFRENRLQQQVRS
jgi:hypothetical protein